MDLPVLSTTSSQPETQEAIQDWLVSRLAELLNIAAAEVDVEVTFDRYGLDSAAAIGLTGDLGDWVGLAIEPTLLYDYPTIQALAQHLGSQLRPQR